MTKKYIFNEHEFTLIKPGNCSMEIAKDGCSVIISVGKVSTKYTMGFHDGLGGYTEEEGPVAYIVSLACESILARLKAEQKSKELCSNLDKFYDKQ